MKNISKSDCGFIGGIIVFLVMEIIIYILWKNPEHINLVMKLHTITSIMAIITLIIILRRKE